MAQLEENVFRVTGFYLFNKHMFTEVDYLAAAANEKPYPFTSGVETPARKTISQDLDSQPSNSGVEIPTKRTISTQLDPQL